MIHGRLQDFESMGLKLLGTATTAAVTWIRQLPARPPDGRYELADGLHALVLEYATRDVDESRFETHRRHVDLQYTLAGAEGIDWAPRDTLSVDGEYDAARDLLFHHAGPDCGRLVNAAGFFALFAPVDAHRPAIRVADHARVTKVVVKIPVDRLYVP